MLSLPQNSTGLVVYCSVNVVVETSRWIVRELGPCWDPAVRLSREYGILHSYLLLVLIRHDVDTSVQSFAVSSGGCQYVRTDLVGQIRSGHDDPCLGIISSET